MRGKPLAAIVSAGMSRFGVLEGRYSREIFSEAAREAFEGCPNLDPKRDIQGVFVGQMAGESFEHQGHWGPVLADWAGLLPAPAIRFETACASSASAMRSAIFSLRSGMYDVVLAGGVEKMTNRTTEEVTEFLGFGADHPFETFQGLTFPGLYALMANAHIHRYGTTVEQMAMVAVKSHRYGALNPKAHFQREITLEKALSSRVVAWPLKLYDCCPISDGAACLVLTRPELARRYTDTPVYIVGSGHASDSIALHEREELTSLKAARLAAAEAYEMSGVEPGDIDVAEVHDCFTIAELIAYEDLDLCARGEGGLMIEEGRTEMAGEIPVNVSGGLKSKGHPVGATGAAQTYEIFRQLRGEAGESQVEDAEVGLTHNVGGSGATAVINIYGRG
ncbi:MAG: thiolase domain-containing protein [Candidatus Bathyarchaeota archaeon]|nr:thiolase domain-containing protein [Candidatus Bathyarchaeota archaeon]